jgi:hypothetical protein
MAQHVAPVIDYPKRLDGLLLLFNLRSLKAALQG